MGLVSLICGLVGVSLAWLPGVGLLGIPLGFTSVIAGLLVMTNRHAKEWHWQYGLAGSILAAVGIALSGAFQFKHLGSGLSVPMPDQSLTVGAIVIAVSLVCVVGAILIGRFKYRTLGIGLGVVAVAALCLASAWTLTIADQEYTRTHPVEQVAPEPT